MYDQSMIYNIPMQGQIPYCPFMRSMYMIPDMMMRSEDLDDELDTTLTDNIEDNLNEDTREDEPDEYIDNFSNEISYDDNQFRYPANPEEILRMIERNNPMVIRRLVMYGIPYHIAKNMVRRIIQLTLKYHR